MSNITKLAQPWIHGVNVLKNSAEKSPLEEVNTPYTVMKYPAFYETLKFISVFTTASH